MRSALYVNLLTEDNLPYYVRDIDLVFGRDEAWGAWARRWTAEEGRHSMAIYGYLMATRAIDPVALERARMVQVSTAQVPQPDDARDALVYLTLQELATSISHRNTGKLIGDPVGYDLMSRVASDENLHHLFYRDVTAAAIELDPSGMVQAIERQVAGFAMPGIGIPDFDRHAALIARAGIYDLAVHHDQILVPVVLRQWRVAELTGLDDAGEASRDRLLRRSSASDASGGASPSAVRTSCRRPRCRGAPRPGHRPHCRSMRQLSLDEVQATLTAPGAPFEMDEVVIRGVATRVWKHAPPNLPAVLDASRAHGDRVFLVYEDEA